MFQRDLKRSAAAGLLAVGVGGFFAYAAAHTPKTGATSGEQAPPQERFSLVVDGQGVRGDWSGASGETGSLRVEVGDGALSIRAHGTPGRTELNGANGGCNCSCPGCGR
jgi:hypothetical protein